MVEKMVVDGVSGDIKTVAKQDSIQSLQSELDELGRKIGSELQKRNDFIKNQDKKLSDLYAEYDLLSARISALKRSQKTK